MKPVQTEYMRRSELIELCFLRAMKIKRLEDKLQAMFAVIQDSSDESAVEDMRKLKEVIG